MSEAGWLPWVILGLAILMVAAPLYRDPHPNHVFILTLVEQLAKITSAR